MNHYVIAFICTLKIIPAYKSFSFSYMHFKELKKNINLLHDPRIYHLCCSFFIPSGCHFPSVWRTSISKSYMSHQIYWFYCHFCRIFSLATEFWFDSLFHSAHKDDVLSLGLQCFCWEIVSIANHFLCTMGQINRFFFFFQKGFLRPPECLSWLSICLLLRSWS